MSQKIHFFYLSPFAFLILMISCTQQPEKDESVTPVQTSTNKTSPVDTSKKATDKNILLGNWGRTDADYQLKIFEVLPTGNLKAGYYNPKSINIGKAMWKNTNDALEVYIQLSDENYPGSYYQLTYIPENYMLVGKYFQAVEGITYDVAFVKAN